MPMLLMIPIFMGRIQAPTKIWSIWFSETFVIYFSFMNPSSSWKRSHSATGSMPNKPSEKRQRNGNRGARKPLDFSSEYVENSEETVNVKSPFQSPQQKVTTHACVKSNFC